MLESLRRVLLYMQAFEKQFVQEQLDKSSEEQKTELAKKRRKLSKAEKRIAVWVLWMKMRKRKKLPHGKTIHIMIQ